MKTLLTVTCLIIFLSACKKDFNQQIITSNQITAAHNLTFNIIEAQFGVFIQKAYADEMPIAGDNNLSLPDSTQVQLDSAYGGKNIRLSTNHIVFASTTQRNRLLTQFKNLWKKGFSIALNINYDSGGIKRHFADSNVYANFVSEVLDSIANRSDAGEQMAPGIVVVENEEINPNYYYNSTVTELDKYIGMLRQAAIKCHNRPKPLHITNGGLDCKFSAELTWNYLKVKYDTAIANAWARKVFSPAIVTQLNNGNRDSDIILGKYLVNAYKTIKYLSYINIHWYEPVIARYWPKEATSPYDAPHNVSPDSYVPGGIDSVVKYYNATASNLKLISNETGQLTYSGTLTDKMMKKFVSLKRKGNFSIVIWYDGDADYTEVISGVKALHNTTSATTYTLRGSGIKFQQNMH